MATAGLVPDLVIVFDVADAVAAARQRSEPDRLEREGAEFHAAVRRAYRELAATRGWLVIPSDDAIDDVAERVRGAVEPLLAG